MKTRLVFAVLVVAFIGDSWAQEPTSREFIPNEVRIFLQNLVLILLSHKQSFVLKKNKTFRDFHVNF